MAKKSIEERVQRLEDIKAVENLMAKYSYMQTAGLHEEVGELFAKKTPGVRVDLMGIYEGASGVQRAMVRIHQIIEVGKPGSLYVHSQTTPVIEIAGDGRTAKGVWVSPGLETRREPRTGKFTAYWLWGTYGVDFVKEDGQWKFWHFHIYPLILTPYNKSWTEPATAEFDQVVPPDFPKPDKPTRSDSVYSTTKPIHYDPVPPEPYETFDEKTAY